LCENVWFEFLGVTLACVSALHAWTVVITDILAQVSSSCLGKSSRSLPWFCSSISLRRRALVLGEKSSRSGESASPKQELVGNPCVFCLNLSPDKGLLFWAKSDIAQTKRSRPSESSQSTTVTRSFRRESVA